MSQHAEKAKLSAPLLPAAACTSWKAYSIYRSTSKQTAAHSSSRRPRALLRLHLVASSQPEGSTEDIIQNRVRVEGRTADGGAVGNWARILVQEIVDGQECFDAMRHLHHDVGIEIDCSWEVVVVDCHVRNRRGRAA